MGEGEGFRVDVNVEVKFFCENSKKKIVGGRGVRWWGGFRVDVNAMLGVGGDMGYGGCEPRIEGILQCTKRYCTIFKKIKKVWGRGNI